MDHVNWDDFRYVQAVAEAGSVRRAAALLKVSHQTVARRIAALEESIKSSLFLRTPEGYLLTPAAEEIARAAVEVSDLIGNAARRVMARNLRPAGTVRVALVDLIVPLLAPDFATFRQEYPDITLELVEGTQQISFSKREADIAIRFADDLSGNLVGHRLASGRAAVYASPSYLERMPADTPLSDHVWIGWDAPWDQLPPAKWMSKNIPDAVIAARVNSPNAMIHLLRAGMGVAIQACLVGDIDPNLRRVCPDPIEDIIAPLWILTHPDLRRAARVRAFMDFMSARMREYRPLIEGACESGKIQKEDD